MCLKFLALVQTCSSDSRFIMNETLASKRSYFSDESSFHLLYTRKKWTALAEDGLDSYLTGNSGTLKSVGIAHPHLFAKVGSFVATFRRVTGRIDERFQKNSRKIHATGQRRRTEERKPT